MRSHTRAVASSRLIVSGEEGEQLANFVHVRAAKKAQLDDFCLASIGRRQVVQRLINGEDLDFAP